ncbi:MAG: protein-disulfide reductase DsbD family protein [Saprospiraceae bacterium]|nr:protein-disulfide reductase DsbD family protein [Saprospiraceae bacterium]
MRLFFSMLVLLACSALAHGQIFDPVKWSFSSQHVADDEYELFFDARIEVGWAIYSQHIEEGGPIPTTFEFDAGDHFTLIGDVQESDNAKTARDPIFDMQLTKFYDKARFTQRVRVKDTSRPIAGYLTFMTCDDERCLPPKDVEYAIVVTRPGNDRAETQSTGDQAPETPAVIVMNLPDDADGSGGDENINPGQQSGLFTPVSWSTYFERTEDSMYLLTVRAELEKGWHIYSQFTGEGPIPTTFYFDDLEGVEYLGEVAEDGPERLEGPDIFFDSDQIKFKKRVDFTQKAAIAPSVTAVTGELEFMVCNDERCLPPDFVEFTFDLTGEAGIPAVADRDGSDMPADVAGLDQSIPSIIKTYEDPVGDCHVEASEEGDSLLWTFVLGFLGGLLALLTPCVFPMIPLTVSFFSKDTKRKGWWNGVVYGTSIIVIYVTVGLLITALFGATALNELSTNWIANTLFFLIFIAFAFSFFGYYEIQLPSKWANRSDRLADKGGLLGIFFMAFTLAIVSFSCTGPIIGSAIVQSATSSLGPFVVMLGFSTALALPFGLFAAFPAWLNSLPRSGSWMNSVKVILGFLELALAFKFLSVADMTSHWGVLRYEVFLGAWAQIAIAMALYLFGVLRFPHDSPVKRLNWKRLTLALGMSVLAVYLVTGFMYSDKTKTYNSLPMLSGLAPPAHYNFFKPVPEGDPEIKARYPSYSKCASNLDCFHDYYEGVAYANEVNKPIFLDFTGYGCVNCRKTEEHIWVKDRVWSKLKNDYVMISLYVDDRKPLDEEIYSKTQNKKLRNIGNKWADFQIANFEQNSQPLYVILSPDEQVLATPRGYREGVEEYAEFLECGLMTFRQIEQRVGELRE